MTMEQQASAQSAGTTSDRVDYERIYLGGKPVLREGKLRLAASGIGWKPARTGDDVVTMAASDIKRCQWMRAARDHELRVVAKSGQVLKFDGFTLEDQPRLRQAMRRLYNQDLEAKEVNVRGWNWGQTEFQGNNLFFQLGNKPTMEIPLDQVGSTTLTAKNEVNLEFRLPTAEHAKAEPEWAKGDQLVEIRFHLPDNAAAGDKEKQLDANGEPIEDGAEPENSDDNAGEEPSAAQQFLDVVKLKADLGMAVGESIVPFHELPFVTPRGRYEVEMFGDFLRMHGKTYDYKIPYKSIKNLFLLPKPDDIHVHFVIALDPAIRQGQTRYPFLVTQFQRDEDLEVDLNMEEEELKEKYGGRLKAFYEAPTHEVVSTVFSVMCDVPLTTSESFKSHFRAAAVKCSLKVFEGLLYPLEDALLFLPKTVTHMPYADIASITFSRVGGGASASSARTFDMLVTMKGGLEYAYSGIPREEYAGLDEFLRLKKLRVKNEMADESFKRAELSSDEDDDSDAGSDDLAPKSKKQRTAASSSAAATLAAAGGDDDEDDEDDEDYVGGDESDVPEEFDEDYTSEESGDGEDGGSAAGDAEE